MISRARSNFQSNWTAIVLAVISIIQGLAFNDLAGRLQTILNYTLATHDLAPAAHFVFSFAVLLRIFQTYVTAALDYDEWVTSFPDVLLIFVLGLIEYYVFSALTVPAFNVILFHERVGIIYVLAALGYIRAFASLHEPMFASYRLYCKERRLQAVNIAGIFAVLALSLLVLLVHPLPNSVYAAIGLAAAAILAFNIGYSLHMTFAPEFAAALVAREPVASPLLAESAAVPRQGTAAALQIRPARRADVVALARLIADHFGYIYSAAFDTSPRMTEKILRSLLSAAGGWIPDLGFRAFQVLCEGEPLQAVGLLKVTTSGSPGLAAGYYLMVPAIVFYHLGLVGLLRTWRNWRILRDTVPKVAADECYIQYIAVEEKCQQSGVGASLLVQARQLAAAAGRARLALDVRETNHKARRFFAAQGFAEEGAIERRSDRILDRGPALRMTMPVA